MTKPILGYWDIRGLAEPIRHVLVYLGVDFEDVRYVQGEGPEFNIDTWLSVKPHLGLAFPNLPYFIDGDLKISETLAILRHVARKYGPGLLGTTIEEQAYADETYGVLADLKSATSGIVYNPNYEALKPSYLENTRVVLGKIVAWLKLNTFLAGENVTYPDFFLVELTGLINAIEPNTVPQELLEYVARFNSTVNTADRYHPKGDYNNPIATFRGRST